jgi:hypothetical protein
MESHLFSLKSVVYDKPYINPKPIILREGYSLISSEEIKYKIRLTGRKINKNVALLNTI